MGKAATIIGAGGRSGTARAQSQLQQTLAETGNVVMVKPGVLVAAFSPLKFDSDGNLVDDDTKELLRKHLEEFAKWVIRVSTHREFIQYACEMDVQLTHG